MTRRTRAGLALAAGAALLVPPALAATGDDLREGVRNPSRGDATEETQIIARTGKDTYGTRQSNLGEGGGAIYGCRSGLDLQAIADPARSTPCVRVNNLKGGKAFDFQATEGALVGVIQAGNSITTPRSDATPFVTNATGLAFGLNADRVDNLHAKEIIDQAVAAAVKAVNDGGGGGGGAGCPTGTTAASGACVETAPRAAAAYAAAAGICGAEGRRLVPPDVLLHARTLAGIDLGGGEMSADLTPDAVALVTNAITNGYATVSDAGAIGVEPLATATAFRCMVP